MTKVITGKVVDTFKMVWYMTNETFRPHVSLYQLREHAVLQHHFHSFYVIILSLDKGFHEAETSHL
jgi:hypothetical protein